MANCITREGKDMCILFETLRSGRRMGIENDYW